MSKADRPKITTDTSYSDDLKIKRDTADVEQASSALQAITSTPLRKTILDWLQTRTSRKQAR